MKSLFIMMMIASYILAPPSLYAQSGISYEETLSINDFYTENLAQSSDDKYYDNSFTFPGLNGDVHVITSIGNNIIVGGEFSHAFHDGELIPLNYIGIWDGENWESLGDGMDGAVIDIAVNSQGHIYAVGGFQNAGGESANRIAVWKNGAWEPLGDGLSSQYGFSVNAVVVSGDDNVYVGGEFTWAGGVTVNGIAMWDGEEWHSLGDGVRDQYNSPGNIRAMQIHSDGSLYVGGQITWADTVNVRNLARWDGERWHDVGGGAGDTWRSVNTIFIKDNDLYVGGDFNSVGGGSLDANFIAKWDGENWSAFGDGPSDHVRSITLDDEGTLYIGGSFLFRYWDGEKWIEAGGGIGSGFYYLYSVYHTNGNVFIGGRFFTTATETKYIDGEPEYNRTAVTRIARLNVNEKKWYALGKGGNGVNGEIHSIVRGPSGELYIGGFFTIAGGTEVRNIAMWDGTQWSSMGGGVSGTVYALAVDGDYVYAGGYFTGAGEVQVNRVARWNGENWDDMGGGVRGAPWYTSPVIHAITVTGNDVYVGGYFEEAGNVEANNIARWDGEKWHSLGEGAYNGVEGNVITLAQHGEDLFVGGSFSKAGGRTVNNITRWDGREWHRLQGGVDGIVRSIAVAGNNIIAAGTFTHALNLEPLNNITVNRIARWNREHWSGMGDGFTGWYVDVNAVSVVADKIFAGGTFWGYVAWWTGTNWERLDWLGAAESVPVVHSLAAGSALYVGGQFEMAGGNDSFNLARWIEPKPENYVYVGLHGDDADEGSFDKPVRTISRAMNMLSDNGTIDFFSGHFDEELHADFEMNIVSLFNPGIKSLRVTDGSVINVRSNITVSEAIDVLSGSVETGYAVVTLDKNASVTESIGNSIMGKIKATRTINAGETSDFGSIGVDIDTGNDDLGDVTVLRVAGPLGRVTSGKNSGIDRHWKLTGDVDAFDSRDLTLWWPSGDDNEIDIEQATVWYRVPEDIGWSPFGGTFDASTSDPRSVTVQVSSLNDITVSSVDKPLSNRFFVRMTQSPRRGSAVLTGSTYKLKWYTGDGIENVAIDIKYGANEWETIMENIAAGTREYDVTFDDVLRESVQFRVRDIENPLFSDSSAVFSMYPDERIAQYVRRALPDGSYLLYRHGQHSWSFSNSSTNMWPYQERFPDWDTFCRTYGDNFCYGSIEGGTYRRLAALSWWGTLKLFDWQGSCSGFSISSLMFFNEMYHLPFRFPGFETLYDVNLSLNARSFVNAHQLKFTGPRVGTIILTQLTSLFNDYPDETLEKLEESLDQYRKHRSLVIIDPDKKSRIHTIQPSRIEYSHDGTLAYIRVYDSNHPGSIKTVTINKQSNSWTYTTDPFNVTDASKGVFVSPEADKYFLDHDIAPYTAGQLPEQIAALETYDELLDTYDTEETHISVYVNPGSALLIQNDEGNAIGMLEDEVLIDMLPDAIPILAFSPDLVHDLPMGYFIPRGAYKVSMHHYTDEPAAFSSYTEKELYTIRQPKVNPQQVDDIVIDNGLGIHSTEAGHEFDFEAISVDGAEEMMFTVESLASSPGDSLHFALADIRNFTLLNAGEAKTVNLSVLGIVEERRVEARYRSIPVRQNSRQLLIPDWTDPVDEPLLILIDTNLDGTYDDTLTVYSDETTGIGHRLPTDELPEAFGLFQNYPNPFNASTIIRYGIKERVNVELSIYNILGQRITTLVNDIHERGYYEVSFDASHLSSGVYIYRLQAGEYVESKKLMLLK